MTDVRVSITFDLSYPGLDEADAIEQAKSEFLDEWNDPDVLVELEEV